MYSILLIIVVIILQINLDIAEHSREPCYSDWVKWTPRMSELIYFNLGIFFILKGDGYIGMKTNKKGRTIKSSYPSKFNY